MMSWFVLEIFCHPPFHCHYCTKQGLIPRNNRGSKLACPQCRPNIVFSLCFFQIFAYMDETSSLKEKWDLRALRFLSVNSIIDPWGFAILRPPVLRVMRSVLCCRTSLRTQEAQQTSCPTQSSVSKQTDLCGQLWGLTSPGTLWRSL